MAPRLGLAADAGAGVRRLVLKKRGSFVHTDAARLLGAPPCHCQCAECPEEPPVILCVGCFGSGAEPGAHKAGHAYRIKDNLEVRRLNT